MFQNPLVKWLTGVLLALVTAALTTGVWPFFKGWVSTRASTDTVDKIEVRLKTVEQAHVVDYARLNSAKGDDTMALTQGEQLQWAIIRIKRLQMQTVTETRARIGIEAMMKMPNPKSDGAKRIANEVRAKFDDLMFKGEDSAVAAQKALELCGGE